MTHRSRTWYTTLFIILAIVIVTAVFSKYTNKPAQTVELSATTTAVTATPFTIIDKKIKDENKKAGYSITATYPVISGAGSADVDIKINHATADIVTKAIEDFKRSTDETKIKPGEDPSTFDITYQIEPNSAVPNIFSVRLNETSFQSGSAHPGQLIETAVFNISTGQRYALSDLFISPDYLNRLSIYSIASLKKSLGNDQSSTDIITEGAAPKSENYRAFTVGNKGIVIIFQEYQVAPYAAGAQEVIVAYPAIRDIINKHAFEGSTAI